VAESETGAQEVMQEHEAELPEPVRRHAHPSNKEYVRIGVILAILTGFEIATSYLVDGVVQIVLLFAGMVLKFVLVVLWFMHLKFDSRTYSRFFVMGVAGAVTLYAVVLMSFRVFLR
jgi:cytochrome c oxidase subunit IV